MESSKEKVEWIEFSLLEPYTHVSHAVFSRHGGLSKGPFASLNLSDQLGDDPNAVKANRELMQKVIGVPQMRYAQQTHGVNTHRVTAKNHDKIPAADALYTTERDLALVVTHADCQAAIFYDPVHEAIGVVHAGWRGSAANIYARTIEAMHRDIGTQAQNLIVCISPSLGPDHAEYKNYKQELPESFWSYQKKPNYFDFWAISEAQLTEAGVLAKNIEISGICTHCASDDYFSYRRVKQTGRNATAVALKS
ncbi:MAG: hypothetical protein RL235_824 [Chlamydiota bacterium]|jgi:YfiH family protein